MWVRCGACRTRYRLADELVEGRRLQLRCRRCSALIPVAPPTAAEDSPEAPGTSAPAAGAAGPPAPPQPQWFVLAGGDLGGPLYLSELRRRVLRGFLAADDYLWKAGMPGWQPAGDVAELRELVDIDAFPRRSAATGLPPPFAAQEAAQALPGAAAVPPYLQPVVMPPGGLPAPGPASARWPVWLALVGPVVVAISLVAVVALERRAAPAAPAAAQPPRRASPPAAVIDDDRPIAIHIGTAEIRIASKAEGEVTRLPPVEVRARKRRRRPPTPKADAAPAPDAAPDTFHDGD